VIFARKLFFSELADHRGSLASVNARKRFFADEEDLTDAAVINLRLPALYIV
jgi:hypothetical protein